MAEYIEREALIEKINREKWLLNSTFPKRKLCVSDVLTCVYNAPTADVVEVRHGYWIEKVYDEVPHEPYSLYHCSLCDEPNARKKNYCPNCGAKTDGKGDE